MSLGRYRPSPSAIGAVTTHDGEQILVALGHLHQAEGGVVNPDVPHAAHPEPALLPGEVHGPVVELQGQDEEALPRPGVGDGGIVTVSVHSLLL